MKRDQQQSSWQSRCILLIVFPSVVANTLLSFQIPERGLHFSAIGISILFALLAGGLRAATPPAAVLGGFLTSSLIYSSAVYPYHWYASGLAPLLTLFLLTFGATRFGSKRKEELSLAEEKTGRKASQVAANLGVAALAVLPLAGERWLQWNPDYNASFGVLAMVAALAESTADTLSSELGQVLGGTPRMVTSWKKAPAGTDGAISIAGTLSGFVGAAIVVLVAGLALQLSPRAMIVAFAAAIFGLFVDSLLGASLEPKGMLNNDAVNFLSTVAAAGSAAFLGFLLS